VSRRLTVSTAPSLSDVLLHDLWVDVATSVLLDIRDGAGIEIGEKRKPIVHVVLEGTIQVIRPGHSDTVRLTAGESLLIFYGDAHQLGREDADPDSDPFVRLPTSPIEAPPSIRVGEGTPTALVFSSVISVEYISPNAFAYRAAPNFWSLRRAGAVDDDAERSIAMDSEQIVRACTGQGGTAFATAFASLHYVHMMRLMSLRLLKDRPLDVRAPNTRRMALVVREIRAHPDWKWTVARLASHVGLSRSTFAEAFLAHEHVAPLTFVTHVRMERAAQLLKSDALTLHEAARRVGYGNEASFARAFKRHWGVSPAEFIRGSSPLQRHMQR
jgi:AraC-like DNA-binding protein